MPSPYITRRFLSGCSCSCIRAARSGGSPTGYSDSEYRPEAGFRQYVWAQYCYSLKVPDTSANTDADFCLAHTFLPVKHQIWRKNNPSIRPSICCYICLVCFERVNKKNKKQRKNIIRQKKREKKRESISMSPYLLWLKVCILTRWCVYFCRIFFVSSSVLKEFMSTRGTSVL